MTAETHESTFSRRISPELCIISSLSHEEGAGKAGWPHAPGACAQKDCARAREPQVQAVTTGLPRAMVLRLIRALPGEPAFATVAFAKPLELSARLSACIGRARTTRLYKGLACTGLHGLNASKTYVFVLACASQIRPNHPTMGPRTRRHH